jgi:hypothetical protein
MGMFFGWDRLLELKFQDQNMNLTVGASKDQLARLPSVCLSEPMGKSRSVLAPADGEGRRSI